jgi:hypothetical protein
VASVELLGRGLHGCVLLATYHVRGAAAGQMVRCAVPWLPGWEKPATAKVFNGPYPAAPAVK